MTVSKDVVQAVDVAARERLLAAALELFNEKGYAGTSVREIVAAAGVSKPVLYYYFKNKEGIYLELMNETYATFQGVLSQLTATSGTSSERIVAFATSIFDAFVDNIAVVRLIYAIFFGPPQGAPFFSHEQYYDSMIQFIGGLVENGVAAGELRPVNVNDVTWAVISCMNTVMEEQLCNDPPRIDREGLVRILNLILDGVAER